MHPTRHASLVALAGAVGMLLLAPAASSQTRGRPAANETQGQPNLLGQYGDWGAYAGSNGGNKVCFVLSKPLSAQTNPPNRPRDPAYLFISTRPADKIRNEVSIVIGYPFKPSSDASAEIGSDKFVLQTQSDGAWVKDAADEERLVEAMRKGADITIQGTSGRGTVSTDRYSLKGVSQALERVAQECR